jgi:hypothetical protein
LVDFENDRLNFFYSRISHYFITNPKSHLPAYVASLKRGIFDAYLYNKQINNFTSKMLCEAKHRMWEELLTFVGATSLMTHNFVNNI